MQWRPAACSSASRPPPRGVNEVARALLALALPRERERERVAPPVCRASDVRVYGFFWPSLGQGVAAIFPFLEAVRVSGLVSLFGDSDGARDGSVGFLEGEL